MLHPVLPHPVENFPATHRVQEALALVAEYAPGWHG
jgi:hypothetical protein